LLQLLLQLLLIFPEETIHLAEGSEGTELLQEQIKALSV
jgi:hypothetical protein